MYLEYSTVLYPVLQINKYLALLQTDIQIYIFSNIQ